MIENQRMPSVLVTGGTGVVGKKLTALLTEKGYSVIILTRNAAGRAPRAGVVYKEWNIEKGEINDSAVAEADYIIHLAGAGVADSRWTTKRKAEIVSSRTESSALLVKAAIRYPNRLKAVISASAIGWYREDGQRTEPEGFEENAPAAPGFLGETCRLWEASVAPFEQMGKRVAILRTGLVLSNDGGVLVEFKKPMKYGLATILGSGEQVMSWIHVEDVCRMYLYALENETITGPYNAVAPAPVKHKDLVLKLAEKVRGKSYTSMHAPGFVLKLMLGEMSIEVLKSATISAAKIKAAGFRFLYPSIDAALEQLTKK
jgi:uncharacterized protein (TIGR01777 family)